MAEADPMARGSCSGEKVFQRVSTLHIRLCSIIPYPRASWSLRVEDTFVGICHLWLSGALMS